MTESERAGFMSRKRASLVDTIEYLQGAQHREIVAREDWHERYNKEYDARVVAERMLLQLRNEAKTASMLRTVVMLSEPLRSEKILQFIEEEVNR